MIGILLVGAADGLFFMPRSGTTLGAFALLWLAVAVFALMIASLAWVGSQGGAAFELTLPRSGSS